MKKEVAVNTFVKGLQMDMNPLTVPSDVLTDCLNGTLITYNGNEQALQNDMGNARVETAMLPAGFIPMGTASLGGVIYIASYNPITQQCQLGSFPSPERNFALDELGANTTLTFQKFSSFNDPSQDISNPIINVQLLDDNLYNGDKFKIFSTDLQDYLDGGYISGFHENNTDINLFPKYLKLNVVSISDSGEIINIGDDLVWTTPDKDDDKDDDKDINSKIPFYIHRGEIIKTNGKVSLDEYRDLIQSNYDVYKAPTSGKLGISAQLEAPNIFQVSYDAIIADNENGNKTAQLYFFVNWANNNIGEHKNRVNPIGVQIDVGKGRSWQNIELPIYSENSVISESPNTINNNDYLGFYSVNTFDTTEEYIKYLETWSAVKYCNLKKRANDGSDAQYIIKGPIIEYNPSTKDSIKISLTPIMPYGKLTYLTQIIEINLEKLGSGIIDLTNYQYFNTATESTINWGLEVYPETNKRLESATFNFYDFKDNNFTSITQSDLESSHSARIIANTPNYTETVLKQNYNGLNTTQFYYNDSFKKDSVYLVELHLKYSTSDIYYYKILHTSNIFNKMFLSHISDFTTLYLYDPIGDNGGIQPIFNTIETNNIIEIPSDYSIIKDYQEDLTVKTYNINHTTNISSIINFQIDSSIESIKILGSPKIGEISTTATIDSNIPLEVNWNPNIKLDQISLDSVIIKGKSEIILPYIIDYKQEKKVDLYTPSSYKGNFTIKNGEVLVSSIMPKVFVEYKDKKAKLFIQFPEQNEKTLINTYEDGTHGEIDFSNINTYFKNYCDQKNYDCVIFSIGFSSSSNSETGFNFWNNAHDLKKDFNGLLLSTNDKYYYSLNEDSEIISYHSITYDTPKEMYVNMIYFRGTDNTAYIAVTDEYSFWEALSKLQSFKSVNMGNFKTIIGDLYKYSLNSNGLTLYTISNIEYYKNPKISLTAEIPIILNNISIQIGNQVFNKNAPNNLRCSSSIVYNYQKDFKYSIINQGEINSKWDTKLENYYIKDSNNKIESTEIDITKVYKTITNTQGTTTSYPMANISLNNLGFPEITPIEDSESYTLGLTSADYGVGDNASEGAGLFGNQDIKFSNIYIEYGT